MPRGPSRGTKIRRRAGVEADNLHGYVVALTAQKGNQYQIGQTCDSGAGEWI